MNEQIDINEILNSLRERIGQLEIDKAILAAQLKHALTDGQQDQGNKSNDSELIRENMNNG